MPSLKTAFGDPTHDGGDVDVYEVTLSTGTSTLTYDEPFKDPPALILTSESGDAGWSARGATQATITGTGSETVFVLAIGDR